MSTLVPRNSNFAIQQCIDAVWNPVGEATDWDQVVANAANLDVDALTAELLAGQPYSRDEVSELKVFRLQSKVRIALRAKQGLPINANHTCYRCGARPAHSVRVGWWSGCLYCEEEQLLVPSFSAHRYDQKLEPAFDISSQTWGLAFIYQADRTAAAAIIVHGYKDHREAVLACYAPERFVKLYNRVCEAGMECDESTVLPIAKLLALNLPLNPEQWRAFCEDNFRQVEIGEAEPYSATIETACDEYFRAKH